MFKQDASLDAILRRKRPSAWSQFIEAPFTTVATKLYQVRQSVLERETHDRTTAGDTPILVVCISDTHNSQPSIPPGDLFIHAGDLSQRGTQQEIQEALNWINTLPHQYKIVIAGNHDMCLDASLARPADQDDKLDWGSIIYLQDTSTVLRFHGGRALTIWGTPHTRRHGSWGFQFPHDADVFSNTVPEDTDILVSHSPPRFHLDVDGWGDENLLKELWRVRPALHIFGHIHEGYGKEVLIYDRIQEDYERIRRQRNFGRIWCLLLMAGQMLYLAFRHGKAPSRVTVAINPSAVGGLRDTLRRNPISVKI